MLEEVVGEIDVGYDFDEYHAKRRIHIEHENELKHRMSARTPISEVNDILHLNLPTGEAHTIGGLVSDRLRCILREGDLIEEQGCRISVLEADERCVLKVEIQQS